MSIATARAIAWTMNNLPNRRVRHGVNEYRKGTAVVVIEQITQTTLYQNNKTSGFAFIFYLCRE